MHYRVDGIWSFCQGHILPTFYFGDDGWFRNGIKDFINYVQWTTEGYLD